MCTNLVKIQITPGTLCNGTFSNFVILFSMFHKPSGCVYCTPYWGLGSQNSKQRPGAVIIELESFIPQHCPQNSPIRLFLGSRILAKISLSVNQKVCLHIIEVLKQSWAEPIFWNGKCWNSGRKRKQDHIRMNVAPDQTIIFIGLQIFLDYRSLHWVQKIKKSWAYRSRVTSQTQTKVHPE